MADFWVDIDTSLAEVPVCLMPLIDDTDFKTIELSLTASAAGMDLVWNFMTTSGNLTQTAVVPTTGGVYDWTNQGNGIYTVEIPASAGGSINNDTAGFGWFSGVITGVLPFRGPTIGVRSAVVNDALIDSDTLLTSLDIGQIYEGAISTVNTQLSFDMDTSIATDDNWLRLTASIEDISTSDVWVTYVSDVDSANNRLILSAAPPFTAVAGDKVRIYAHVHPEAALSNYGAALTTDTDAIKTKTDQLTFTVSGKVDSNLKTVLDTDISEGTEDLGRNIGY